MTPAARIQAAIQILDRIMEGDPAEPSLLGWARNSRFAGSGDRAAVRDLVFDSLRRRNSRAALGGGLTGRHLMLGMCRDSGLAEQEVFTGQGHAPALLTSDERAGGRDPDVDEALDIPVWLLPHWRASLGQQADQIARMMRDRAPIWLRANPVRADLAMIRASLNADGIEVVPSAVQPTALQVMQGGRRVSASTAYREGMVELQDLSAQLACDGLPVGGRVLDFCAGGGGKSLALAAMGATDITAHDLDPLRMRDLPNRAARAQVDIRIAGAGQITGSFDLVVADVPCSGAGTWRRTPDAKWRLTPRMIEGLLQAQAGILDETARFVRPGGHLAYMTCSIFDCENRQQVGSFRARNPAFQTVSEVSYTPLTASDGFYLHLLQRC